MPRFFVTGDQVRGDEIVINGSDVNHIKNVLRMECQDKLEVCDGCGRDYACVIKALDKDAVYLHIEKSWDSLAELDTQVYLFQGLPKADKMELIIQKAVELGAYAIVPTVTTRTIVKLDDKKEAKKLTRWQQIAESAAKQSGRAIVPKVQSPITFKEAVKWAKEMDAAVIPYEKAEGMDAARKLVMDMKDKKTIGVFIGPEGGFEEAEIAAAKEAGIHPMSLGRRILRTETAGLTILSILMFEFDK